MSTAADVYTGLVKRALNSPTILSAAVVVEQLKDHPALESEEEATLVAGMGIACHDSRVELEREVKKILDPLNEARQAIFNAQKPRLELFKTGEARAKELVGEWNRKKEATHRAAMEASAARAEAAGDGPPVAVSAGPPPPTLVRSMGRTMHETTVWKVVITDKAAAFKSKPDLFDLRATEAKQLLSAGVVIPGLELVAEKTQVIR